MVGPTKLVRYYDGLTYWDVPLGVGQPLYVIIRHGGQPVVITTDSLHGNLTISDPAPGGGFGPPGNDYHHKARRKLDGHIDGVSYKDTFGADVTMPAPVNHNASVDFCYQ
jgi:hypothetical protein